MHLLMPVIGINVPITGGTVGALLVVGAGGLLSQVPDVATGQLLASGGLLTAPAYTATPTVTNMTLSGRTAGRVAFYDTGGAFADDTALLWDKTNNFLGVGGTPTVPGHFVGNGSLRGATVGIASVNSTGGLMLDSTSAAVLLGVFSGLFHFYFVNSSGSLASTDEVLQIDPDGVIATKAGKATAPTNLVKHGGNLKTNSTAVGNTNDVNEDNLITYSLPASVLGTNNDCLELDFWGTFANTVSNKTLRIYFGATVLLNTGALAFKNSSWRVQVRLIRIDATHQDAIVTVTTSDTLILAAQSLFTTAGETLSNAITIKATGQTDVAAANDVVQEGFNAQWRPAA